MMNILLQDSALMAEADCASSRLALILAKALF